MWVLIYLAIVLAGVIWLLESGKNAGEDKAKMREYEQREEDEHTARLARQRIDSDPDYLARVRERFRRK